MATNSLHQPQTYYIYSLTDPRDNQVYYVGQTTNLRNRTFAHKSYGRAKASGAPVYQHTGNIIASGNVPIITELDNVITMHREIVMRLEACWIAEMNRRGFTLYNSWHTGSCTNQKNPLGEIELIKSYALATVDELRQMNELLIRQVVFRTFEDW